MKNAAPLTRHGKGTNMTLQTDESLTYFLQDTLDQGRKEAAWRGLKNPLDNCNLSSNFEERSAVSIESCEASARPGRFD